MTACIAVTTAPSMHIKDIERSVPDTWCESTTSETVENIATTANVINNSNIILVFNGLN